MRVFHYLSSFLTRIERLDFQQYALLVVLIVAFGFYCLRGFGSRSNY
jgi:hypothetical protein